MSRPTIDNPVTMLYNRDMKSKQQHHPSVKFDWDRVEARVDGERVPLTVLHMKVLQLLIKADGRVLTREQIAKKIWGIPGDVHKNLKSRTIDQQISRIRRRLRVGKGFIRTVAGIGYSVPRPE